MRSPADDLARWLGTQGIGVFGQDISVGMEPASPIEVVTLYDTGGEPPDTVELDLFRSTIQVRVRSKNYAVAYNRHEQIRDTLILPGRIDTGSSVFVEIDMTSDIASIGRDDNDRYLMTANYRVIRERS